jgi:hypothetical protein
VRAKLVDAGRTRAAGLTADGYVRGVLDFLDDFEPVRSCWP